MSDLLSGLCEIVGNSRVKTGEEMKKHTTFRVGGPAAYYVSPGDCKELAGVIRLCRGSSVPYYILGNGSNLLVGDKGYDGVMISMTEGFKEIECDGRLIKAGAGASLSRIARTALEASLTGFEFAAGIPGTLGGAVVMNAGAYGSEMKDVLRSVLVMTHEGEERRLLNSQLDLGYRCSCIPGNHYIVLEAEIELEEGDMSAVKARMDQLAEQRKSKQPLEYPSAGSTFKRPEGSYAGKLIEEAGLRGLRCGGAQVSEKHCGFVINRDHATAADILKLCGQIKEKVRAASGVELSMEVKKLGRF